MPAFYLSISGFVAIFNECMKVDYYIDEFGGKNKLKPTMTIRRYLGEGDYEEMDFTDLKTAFAYYEEQPGHIRIMDSAGSIYADFYP